MKKPEIVNFYNEQNICSIMTIYAIKCLRADAVDEIYFSTVEYGTIFSFYTIGISDMLYCLNKDCEFFGTFDVHQRRIIDSLLLNIK
jgi:hypothetical protein